MSILLLADHAGGVLGETTARAVSAAHQIGGDIHILVAGRDCGKPAEAAARLSGVSRVLTADDAALEHQLPEAVAALLAEIGKDYDVILGSAGSAAKAALPRAAALLDVMQVSEIVEIVSADTFKRPIYAGNAIETVQSTDAIKVITVRTSAFEPAPDGGSAPVEPVAIPALQVATSFVGFQASGGDRPDLGSARIVVSGGRALGSKEQFEALINPLAEKLNAAIGASRAAVDSGYVPNDCQVGQTGKVVAPELYFAIGISGAIQHLAGMQASGIIVAINNDPEAPIFRIADYGLVADIFEAVPELTGKI